jgi:uncharacterized membrane protein YdjX (TVP38/TMEM64 family)
MNRKIDATTKKLLWTIIVYCALLALVSLALWPFIKQLTEPAYRIRFQQWVASLGALGWLVLFGIQILQIVVAFIPGGPVEIIAGALYGTLGGLAICLVGCLVASALVFVLTRRFGTPLIYRLFSKEKVDGFTFLKDSKRIESVTFILFLIPGTPKDMLTYVAGISTIHMSSFLIISMLARIPAMVLSLMVGSTVSDGNWQVAIVLFVLTAVIGLVGIKYKDRIIGYCHTLGARHKNKRSLKDGKTRESLSQSGDDSVRG